MRKATQRNSIFGNPITLQGGSMVSKQFVVVDTDTGEFLESVNILLEKGRGLITDANGAATITDNPDQKVTFSYVGYQTRTLRLSDLGSLINLTKKIYSLETVNLTMETKPKTNSLIVIGVVALVTIIVISSTGKNNPRTKGLVGAGYKKKKKKATKKTKAKKRVKKTV